MAINEGPFVARVVPPTRASVDPRQLDRAPVAAAASSAQGGSTRNRSAVPDLVGQLGWLALHGRRCARLSGLRLLPAGLGRDVLYGAVTWTPVVAILAGIRLHRPTSTRPWVLLAAGLACSAAGEVLSLHSMTDPETGPDARAPIAFYLAALVVSAAAITGFARARRPARDAGLDAGGLLDAAALTAALGLLLWTFFVRPLTSGRAIALPERVLAVLYATGAIVLVVVLLRLLTAPRGPEAAYRLLLGAGALGVLSTLTLQVRTLIGAAVDGSADITATLGLMLTFTLAAAAALHPSMASLTAPAPDGGTRRAPLTRQRLMLLASATLVTPATLLGQLASGTPVDGWGIAAGSAVISVLVLARLVGLLHRVQIQSLRLAELADTDPLTGVPNRRAWTRQLHGDLARATRSGAPLAVAVLDLDHFKAYNDTHGHPAGDAALLAAAQAWQARLRAGDLLARLGGEEFVALLAGATRPAALAIAEDLRRATPPGLSVSIGIACCSTGDTGDILLARADAALYEAKRAGRNRIHTDEDRPSGDCSHVDLPGLV